MEAVEPGAFHYIIILQTDSMRNSHIWNSTSCWHPLHSALPDSERIAASAASGEREGSREGGRES